MKLIRSGQGRFEKMLILGEFDFSQIKNDTPRLVFVQCVFQSVPRFGTRVQENELQFIETGVWNHTEKFVPVPSSAVANSLRGGASVHLSGVVLQGPLQLGSPEKTTTALGGLVLANCEIPDGLAISDLLIKSILITRCRFLRAFEASRIRISDDFLLDEDEFEREVSISRVEVGGTVSLTYSSFHGLGVQKLDAKGPVYIHSSRFLSSDSGDVFHFLQSTAPSLDGGQISSGGLLLVQESQIQDIFLSGHTDEISIESSNVARQLNLVSLSVDKTFSLKNTVYRVAYFDWRILNRQFKPTIAELMQLEAAYMAVGEYLLANDAYYARKRLQNRYPTPILSRIVNFVFVDLSTGYGARPLRIIPYSLTVVLIFALLFSHPRALSSKAGQQQDFASRSFVGRLVASVHFSFEWFFRMPSSDWEPSRVTTQMLRVRLPRSLALPTLVLQGRPFKWAAYCEAILSWFLLALFIATAMRFAVH